MVSEILNVISSHKFAAYVGVASDERTAAAIAMAHPDVARLTKALLEERSTATEVLQFVVACCQRDVDARYEAPWDCALLAALCALEFARPDVAEFAARYVMTGQNLFWASRRAVAVLARSEAKRVKSTSRGHKSLVVSNTRDSLILARPGAPHGFIVVSPAAVSHLDAEARTEQRLETGGERQVDRRTASGTVALGAAA